MTDPTQTGGLSPRQQAMADIAARAHEQQAPDLASFDEETGQIEQRAEQVEPAEHVAEQPTEQVVEQVVEQPAEQVEPRTVQIVVNGQTIDVPEDRIIEAGRRTLQKESAADQRLQEATDLMRRAEAFAAARGYAPSSDAREQAPSKDAPQVDPETLLAQVEQRVEQKILLRDAERAEKTFRQEFSDIANDPFLWSIVLSQEQQRIARATALGDPLGDPLEAYRAHGEAVRKWLGKTKPAPVAVEDRTAEKRTIIAVGGANAKAQAPKEDKPETPQDVIERMRLARYQRAQPIHPAPRRA